MKSSRSGCSTAAATARTPEELDTVAAATRAALADAEAAGPHQAELTCAADVAPQPVEWLWLNRIALGKLTILAGDHKGEVVSTQAQGLVVDELTVLGTPGTLTVRDGEPSLVLE